MPENTVHDQFEKFLQVLTALNTHEVEYILIGGVAVIFHGMERLTRDIDIFVKLVPENIIRLRQALHAVFDDASIEEITIEALCEYPVIRYGTPDDFYIDIMAKLGEVATYADLEYEVIEHHGIPVRLATPKTLYDLKKETVRQKDRQDAAFLRRFLNENS